MVSHLPRLLVDLWQIRSMGSQLLSWRGCVLTVLRTSTQTRLRHSSSRPTWRKRRETQLGLCLQNNGKLEFLAPSLLLRFLTYGGRMREVPPVLVQWDHPGLVINYPLSRTCITLSQPQER